MFNRNRLIIRRKGNIMYKKYMVDCKSFDKENEEWFDDRLFFDTKEQIKEYMKNNEIRIGAIFELVKTDLF